MAIDTSAGFKYMGRLSGSPDWIITLKFKDDETLTKGDLVNLESGEADLAATNDNALVGVAIETKTGTDSTTEIKVQAAPDAIYAVYDPNARAIGATLDISGATGAMTVAASSNADLIVVGGESADEWTLVMIAPGEHFLV